MVEDLAPRLLDSFSPASLTMKPCVSTVLNGGAPLPASEINREDWNQPRCWSLPSRYMSACQRAGGSLPAGSRLDSASGTPAARCSSGRRIKTEREDEPESIQTSSESLDLPTGPVP